MAKRRDVREEAVQRALAVLREWHPAALILLPSWREGGDRDYVDRSFGHPLMVRALLNEASELALSGPPSEEEEEAPVEGEDEDESE